MPPSDRPDAVSLQDLTARGDDYNAQSFLIESMTGRLCTTQLVQVKSVTNAGGPSAIGRVSVQPMVAQVDGAGNAVAHGVINDVPYFRLQGGANAIILDPVVGDIGIAVFAMRDISSVKASRAVSNPGSKRRYDWADALYIGGVLNGAPTQYISFTGGGVSVKTTGSYTVEAASIAMISPTMTHNGVNVGSTHAHTGVQTGSGTSGPPVP